MRGILALVVLTTWAIEANAQSTTGSGGGTTSGRRNQAFSGTTSSRGFGSSGFLGSATSGSTRNDNAFNRNFANPLEFGRSDVTRTATTGVRNAARRATPAAGALANRGIAGGMGRMGAMGGMGAQVGTQIRPNVQVAFSTPVVAAVDVDQSLATTFQAPDTGLPSGVQWAFDGGRVTLTGQANSIEEARLAAAVASLEPGVREVVNQIVVPPPANAVEDR